MKYQYLNYHENPVSMNKIFSAFLGWIVSLCTLAKIPLPFLSWFSGIHTSDMILLIIAAFKGAFVAVTSWAAVTMAQHCKKYAFSKWRSYKQKNNIK